MATFDSEVLGEEVITALYQYINWGLLPRIFREWNPNLLPEHIAHEYRSAPLFKDIDLLVRVANGAYRRETAGEEFLEEVLATTQAVQGDLRRPPFGPAYMALSDEFAETQLGQVLNRAEVWLLGDELVTLSEAAWLFTGRPTDRVGRMVIERLVAKWEQGRRDKAGEREGLQVWIDPFEPNPQKNKRVRRSDVLKIKKDRTGAVQRFASMARRKTEEEEN
jgi:hypothetical protein